MRIKVVSGAQNRHEPVLGFTTSVGTGRGRWVGEPVPTSGQYDVELDIEAPRRWGETIKPWPDPVPTMWVDGVHVHLAGTVDSVTDARLLTIRLAGNIVDIEVDDLPSSGPPVGSAVTVTVEESVLALYPYHL